MKPRIDIEQIKKDIRGYYRGILLCLLVLLVCEILFSEICPLRLITGFPCPACGMTRAFFLLITFQFEKAFQMHPFIYLVPILALTWCLNRYVRWRKKPAILSCHHLFIYGIICIIILMIYYLWRMVAYFPGNPPMDYFTNSLLGRILGK